MLPEVLPELTHRNVLAMTYVSGSPIDTIIDLPQAERDRVMSALIELMLLEFFELRMVQTDPNFANYQYRRKTGEIVLLDFGATRRFKAGFVNNYKKLARAAMAGDEAKLVAAAERLGYAMGDADSAYRELVLQFLMLALEPVCQDVAYDFARSDMARNMSKLGEDVSSFRDFWQAPPSGCGLFSPQGGRYVHAGQPTQGPGQCASADAALAGLIRVPPRVICARDFLCLLLAPDSAASRNSSKEACRQSA